MWHSSLSSQHTLHIFIHYFVSSQRNCLSNEVISSISIELKIIATGLTVIDCSASSDTTGVLTRVVELDCCVVMANKKPLSSSMVTNYL